MLTNKRFTIIGGDLRNIKLAEILTEEGNSVNIFGFNQAGFELKNNGRKKSLQVISK